MKRSLLIGNWRKREKIAINGNRPSPSGFLNLSPYKAACEETSFNSKGSPDYLVLEMSDYLSNPHSPAWFYEIQIYNVIKINLHAATVRYS